MGNLAIPSKEQRKTATESYRTLRASVEKIEGRFVNMELDDSNERIKIPIELLEMMVDMLKAMSQGKVVSFVPIAAELTTQMAADILNCSRPHVVSLLEKGIIPFTKVGRHRRIKFEDITKFKQEEKAKRESHLIEMMKEDEESGLYDS